MPSDPRQDAIEAQERDHLDIAIDHLRQMPPASSNEAERDIAFLASEGVLYDDDASPANETTGEPPHGLTLRRWAESLLRHAEDRDGLVWVTKAEVQAVLDAAPSTPAGDGLRARHHEHVHRDGCHRWFDHAAHELLDLAGPAGWCEGCGEDWPCDTTRALNRLALASQPRNEDGLDVSIIEDARRWREAEAEGHTVDFTEDGYGLQHPPSCRPNLIGCRFNVFLADYGEPVMGPGRYRMTWAENDDMPVFAQSGEAAGEGAEK